MKMTLIGMEKYINPSDSIINHMELPAGIDKETLLCAIILRCQEFELLYPDKDFFLMSVKLWSKKHYRTFDKWLKALQLEYNPISNYDRTEVTTDDHAGSFDRKGKTEGNEQNESHVKTDSSITNSVSGFNSPTFENKDKEVTDATDTRNGSSSFNNNDSSSGSDKFINQRTSRISGNIGVTTSQMMVQSELDLSRFNLYEQIADLFCNEFCIMVY